MPYKFIDDKGTFIVQNPHRYNLYFPLTNADGTLLSSISPNLGGDIKQDNSHFLTLPASIEDVGNNLFCRRDFFIKAGPKITRVSSLSPGAVEAGFLYHKVVKETKLLRIEVLNFIPWDSNAEVMRLRVINKTNKTINITPTSLIPLYGRDVKNIRDHRHVTSLLNRIELDKYGIYLKPTMVFDESGHSVNETIYYVLGYEGKGNAPWGQFPSLEYFCGGGDLVSPDAIKEDVRPVGKAAPDFQGKESVAAFRFKDKQIKADSYAEYFLIAGITEDKGKIKDTFIRLNSPSKIEDSLKATKGYWLKHLETLDFDFKDSDFNNWLRWVKFQPILRRLFGCSFLPHFDYGKGGRGWRDLWQDALALLLSEPDKAGEMIVNNFKGIRIDGSNATIITKEGGFISDRNNIKRVWMDHGIWPYLTLKFYINKTGDLDVLLRQVTYFRDHLLKRAKKVDHHFGHQDYILRCGDDNIYKGSILEHILIQNLTAFFNVGRHNIIRLENADWNDGLDMAYEEGESVAFSFMYAGNLHDLAVLLEELKVKHSKVKLLKETMLLLDRVSSPVNYSHPAEKQFRLKEYLERVENISGQTREVNVADLIADLRCKAKHLSSMLNKKEWLDTGFFNGYYDNKSRRVEGRFGRTVRMMLAPQVFSIMSGIATDEKIKSIWPSIKRYLLDKKTGGFRLNTDFGSIYTDLGRAFGFSYGNKENGAVFNHMVVMLANALYKRGFISEGFEALNSIYRMSKAAQANIYPGMPEYFDNNARGLYMYLTGSASWYIYTLIEEALGVGFLFGDIVINPKLIPDNFLNSSIEAKFSLDKKRIRVIYLKEDQGNKPYQIKEVLLNGRKIILQGGGYIIKRQSLKDMDTIEVFLQTQKQQLNRNCV